MANICINLNLPNLIARETLEKPLMNNRKYLELSIKKLMQEID